MTATLRAAPSYAQAEGAPRNTAKCPTPRLVIFCVEGQEGRRGRGGLGSDVMGGMGTKQEGCKENAHHPVACCDLP